MALPMMLLPAVPAGAASTASFECLPACTAEVGSTLTFRSTSVGDGGIRRTDWDLDDDGAYDDATGPSATKAFPTAGSFVVGVQVTDGTAAVVRATRTVVIRGAGPLPFAAPAADTDGDGVGGPSDRCPRSVGKGRAYAGCTAADLVIDPAAVAGPVLQELATTRKGRTKLTSVKPVLRLLRKGALALSRNVCRGAGLIADADDLVDARVDAMQGRLFADTVRLLVKEARKGRGRDAGSVDSALSAWQGTAAHVEQAARDAGKLSRAARRACDVTKEDKVRFEGRVDSVDPLGLTARLDNGRTVALARAGGVPVVPGLRVEGTGFQVGPAQGGVLVATEVGAQVGVLVPVPCVGLPVFAPVQDFNVGAKNIFYLDRRGYIGDDVYRLEGGMGIGAYKSCSGGDHRLTLALRYTNVLGKKVTKLIGNLYADPAVDYPAILPNDVDPDEPASLRGVLWEYDCQLFGDVVSCDQGGIAGSWDAPVELRHQGGWAAITYSSGRYYSVEDGSATDFDVATLGPPVLSDAAGFQPGISFAIGYGLVNGTTTYPTKQYVVQGQQFALHDDVPAFDPAGYFDYAPGVPGGLVAAYVDGTRNGYQVQYVAEQPNIVTDEIADCPAPPDTYYRLPWKVGTEEAVSQGNQTNFTHNGSGKFAFDFMLGETGDSIRAARGGVVESVEESYTKNSNPKVLNWLKENYPEYADLYWKPANTLRIRHQDGYSSLYAHMKKNGVLVEVGDLVEPGDKVAIVGNTGNSTGPHLHFEVDDKKVSISSRFIVGPVGQETTCVTPVKQSYTASN
jgi:peptidase M23-like protein/PKD domain-containing protein